MKGSRRISDGSRGGGPRDPGPHRATPVPHTPTDRYEEGDKGHQRGGE
jgi:hypothetical protein